MRLAALGSGSRGNGLLVEHGQTCLLVDCGFSLRATLERLRELGRTAEDLSGILVTHEHSDHIKGVQALSLRYQLPVYMTHGTARHRAVDGVQRRRLIRGQAGFRLGDIDVQAVTVPHDAREPCQYVFEAAGRKLGILTDLGHVTPQVQQSYSDCDGLFVESNHDEQMLADGPYPHSLKRRVGGNWGHLSNAQTRGLLLGLSLDRLQHLVVGHISEKNNAPELVAEALRLEQLEHTRVCYAEQDQILNWIDFS
jgi:phosphoribosyl 1,2-cyclic phosphodiesterase